MVLDNIANKVIIVTVSNHEPVPIAYRPANLFLQSSGNPVQGHTRGEFVMSDERKEILRMLAEKMISVDEAERLLRALDKGDQKRRERNARSETSPRDSLRVSLDSLGEALSEVGPSVKGVVEEAVSGLAGLRFDEEDDDEEESTEITDKSFPLAEGTSLIIRNTPRPISGNANLSIEAVEGNVCEINSDDARNVRVRQGTSRTTIKWTSGSLLVKVPTTVSKLKGNTMGGDIGVQGLACHTVVKTMGGDLSLQGISGEFAAKTMGGGISIRLDPAWHGDSKAVTMGGAVSLAAPVGVNAAVRAVTMGGRVDVEDGMGQVIRGSSFINQRIDLTLGEDEPTSKLMLKTMGGDISIRRLADER
jgi:DUF4097 and DUF4098 domain-containing protein YvlB